MAAKVGEEEIEYESDQLFRRRRRRESAASDDEECCEDEEEEEGARGSGNVGVEVSKKEIEKIKKEKEPPSAGGRPRRKLWESKDNKKWGHDNKFVEMTLQERHYEQGRRTIKGNFLSRGGKSQGPELGYTIQKRSKSFSNGNITFIKIKPKPSMEREGVKLLLVMCMDDCMAYCPEPPTPPLSCKDTLALLWIVAVSVLLYAVVMYYAVLCTIALEKTRRDRFDEILDYETRRKIEMGTITKT